ncbi:hypothetical protein LAUMK7_00876 [Mycobacterium kansasii]|uniref:Uncharacterized protein n=2 Tax=Mycobacterium kansasii TaxID=1768 RepID=A0A653EYR7_MYCKA|nr:hypothetical protein MKAN_17800 [Mycobacterium kansasii ATCC 12478]VAZ58469.1 hypothetical protein LAUMK22_00257 [Mycobacterium kansasii]VAZ64866.1 hypothetical protein LAUMK40_00987 [Mycobacterium kansasii]VAZ71550.1 hypothetical protein LAUMK7_00876 [Mycobacterium kansasii]VTP02674.1 hypothetical protein BIN_B_03594 [Mycobacterium kansasii]
MIDVTYEQLFCDVEMSCANVFFVVGDLAE